MRIPAPTLGALAALLAIVASVVPGAFAQEPTTSTLTPTVAHTIALSRCGAAGLSTADANCRGFDAREVRETPDMFVVGFENDQELGEKHVLQVALTFDLSQIPVDQNSEVTHAVLSYAEASTTRRSASGDSEYGVLQTCNTQLGVPTGDWNGAVDRILPTRPAQTAGVTPATTGEAGSWDVTPQVKQWLSAGQTKGTLVMRADDESADIHAQSMCLSYLFDLNMGVEVSPKQQ
jgi:hypothetical protein